eukprot:5095174-Alexandrium_andersonii.AAC.1
MQDTPSQPIPQRVAHSQCQAMCARAHRVGALTRSAGATIPPSPVGAYASTACRSTSTHCGP